MQLTEFEGHPVAVNARIRKQFDQTDPERVKQINGEAASGPSHLFRLDLREASTVTVADSRDHLVIELWTADGGARTITRA